MTEPTIEIKTESKAKNQLHSMEEFQTEFDNILGEAYRPHEGKPITTNTMKEIRKDLHTATYTFVTKYNLHSLHKALLREADKVIKVLKNAP